VFEGAALLPLQQIPPFVGAVLPLAAQLPPLVRNLTASLPPLISSFKVLNYVTNEVAYNGGRGNPGFLYWLSWFAHNVDSFQAGGDAHGSVWRSLLLVTCAQLKGSAVGPLLTTLLGTTFGC
jgi:hypothetical protein